MPPRIPGGCSRVVAYLWWNDGDLGPHYDVLAEEYWPLYPGLQEIEGRSYIVSNAAYHHLLDPTHERLENGEVRAMPKSRWSGGRVYFNRSRRIVPHA